MPANIAPTSFQTSIDDTLAAVDTYTQTTASAPDATTSSAGNDPSGLTSFLGADAASIPALSSLKDVTSLPLTAAEVKSSVIAPNSDLLSSFSSLDPSLQTQLCSATGLSSNKIVDTLAAQPTSLLSSVTSSVNLTGVSAMLDVVGGKTKASLSVSNISAQAAFLSNLVTVSAKLNLPNAYSRIAAGGFSADVMGQVLKASLRATVANSHVNLLVDMANHTVNGAIKAVFPGFAASFAAHFKFGTGTHPQQHAQIGLDIATAFGRIDAHWASTSVGNRTMVNASLFANASADFKTVLKASLTYSRGALKASVSVSAGLAASTIPTQASLPPAYRYKTTANGLGQPTTTFISPSGEVVVFAPNASDPTTFDRTTSTPLPLTTDPGDIAAVDTSALMGDLAAPAAFVESLTKAQTNATIDPMLDASASLKRTFPLTTLNDLPVLA